MPLRLWRLLDRLIKVGGGESWNERSRQFEKRRGDHHWDWQCCRMSWVRFEKWRIRWARSIFLSRWCLWFLCSVRCCVFRSWRSWLRCHSWILLGQGFGCSFFLCFCLEGGREVRGESWFAVCHQESFRNLSEKETVCLVQIKTWRLWTKKERHLCPRKKSSQSVWSFRFEKPKKTQTVVIHHETCSYVHANKHDGNIG